MKAKKETANENKRGFYEHRPNREFKASLSKDGKYWIFKDITTHIVPREYLDKVKVDQAGGRGGELHGGNKKVDD